MRAFLKFGDISLTRDTTSDTKLELLNASTSRRQGRVAKVMATGTLP